MGYPARGPYIVEKKITDLTYRVNEEETGKSLTVHVNDLRPCRSKKGQSNWVLEKVERENREVEEEIPLEKGDTKSKPTQTDASKVKSKES